MPTLICAQYTYKAAEHYEFIPNLGQIRLGESIVLVRQTREDWAEFIGRLLAEGASIHSECA